MTIRLLQGMTRAVRIGQGLAFLALMSMAGAAMAGDGLALAGIPVDFVLFALVLLGVALFHDHTLKVALGGVVAIIAYKLAFTGFKAGDGLPGLAGHFVHEWVTLANLLCLLMVNHSSSGLAKGIPGTSGAATRITGASRSENACSAMRAAISAP